MLSQNKRFRNNPLAGDLDHILAHTAGLWEELRGMQLFITGGTGFFGCWLLESFAWVNRALDLKASALVLTRNPSFFQKKFPHLAGDPAISFWQGDVRDFAFPDGEFSHMIHAAATSALATYNNEDPLVKFDTLLSGTKRSLDFAAQCKARKFLLTSSGAVYGKQPTGMTHIAEEYRGAPDSVDPNSAWGEGKRVAEFLSAYYSNIYGFEVKVARCFSFVGPHLPLDIHYAIGNFIRDAINGGPIQVLGDGSSYRSYLYAADLAIWLWTILFRGESCRPYNVGSEAALTIAELATAVSRKFPQPIEVRICRDPDPGLPPHRYVPSTRRARESLGLREFIGLQEAIRRTISHQRWVRP